MSDKDNQPTLFIVFSIIYLEQHWSDEREMRSEYQYIFIMCERGEYFMSVSMQAE